jgi:hypothetical protein
MRAAVKARPLRQIAGPAIRPSHLSVRTAGVRSPRCGCISPSRAILPVSIIGSRTFDPEVRGVAACGKSMRRASAWGSLARAEAWIWTGIGTRPAAHGENPSAVALIKGASGRLTCSAIGSAGTEAGAKAHDDREINNAASGGASSFEEGWMVRRSSFCDSARRSTASFDWLSWNSFRCAAEQNSVSLSLR